jgi:hypothetical protein
MWTRVQMGARASPKIEIGLTAPGSWPTGGLSSRLKPHCVTVSKFSRGASAWKEHRLADRLELDGAFYTVQLVARRGTGVQGYRVTVHFIPHDTGPEVLTELPNAASTADVHRVARELEADPARLASLYHEARTL